MKLFFQADISSKKSTNKLDFTTCRLVFILFLEESEDTKKHFEIKWPLVRLCLSNLEVSKGFDCVHGGLLIASWGTLPMQTWSTKKEEFMPTKY